MANLAGDQQIAPGIHLQPAIHLGAANAGGEGRGVGVGSGGEMSYLWRWAWRGGGGADHGRGRARGGLPVRREVPAEQQDAAQQWKIDNCFHTMATVGRGDTGPSRGPS